MITEIQDSRTTPTEQPTGQRLFNTVGKILGIAVLVMGLALAWIAIVDIRVSSANLGAFTLSGLDLLDFAVSIAQSMFAIMILMRLRQPAR